MTQLQHAVTEPLLPPRRGLAVAVLMVGALTDMIDVSIVNVALPTIGRRVSASSTSLEWIVSAYMVAFAAVLIVAGNLGDILGRRRLFLLGTAIFGAASLGAGLAATPGVLIMFRALQGAAAATMIPQVLATFRVLFPRSERGVVFGIYGAVLGLASAAGVALGGVIVDPHGLDWGWRGIFLVNVPVCALAFAGTLWLVPESTEARGRAPDLPAAVGLVCSLVAVVFPLLEGRRLGWPAWLCLVLAAGLGGLAAVARRGARTPRHRAPVLPAGLLRIPAAAAGLLIQLAFSVGLQGLMLSFALFLQVGQHASPLRAGLTLLAFSVGGVFSAPQAASLAERYGRRVLVVGASLLVVGVAGMVAGAHAIDGGPGPWPIVPGLVAAGAGLGLLVVPLVNVVLAAVPPGIAGSASGAFSTAQQLGGALGVALIGTLFFAHSAGRPDLSAFTVAAVGSSAAFVLCGLLCLALPRTALSEDDVIEIVAAGGGAAVDFRRSRSSTSRPTTQEDTMKYMLLIHQGTTPTPHDPEAWAQLPEEEQQAVFAAYQQLNQTPGVTPGVQMGEPDTATTVRVESGRTLTTDGPFVDTKEALGGYLFYEADDLDAAIELAAKIPPARLGGAIEIRPIVEY